MIPDSAGKLFVRGLLNLVNIQDLRGKLRGTYDEFWVVALSSEMRAHRCLKLKQTGRI